MYKLNFVLSFFHWRACR